MAENKPDYVGVEGATGSETEQRRKSLGFTPSWSQQPPARKYSLNDAPDDCKGTDSDKLEEVVLEDSGGPKSPTKKLEEVVVDSGGPKSPTKKLEEVVLENSGGPKSPTSKFEDVVLESGGPKSPTKQEIFFEGKDPKPVQKSVERTKKVQETPAGPSSMPPTPNTAMKMSCMEEEAIRERLRSLLLRQTAQLLEAEGVGIKFTKDSFRRTFLNKEILSRLFQLFDQDRDNQLVQEEWIEFLKERLTDEKQIDLAEQLESVAFVLCGEEHISLDKFCQIFQAKGIVDKLFRMIDTDSDGIVTPPQIMEFLATLSNARPRTGFDKRSLECLEQLFRLKSKDVKGTPVILREDFEKLLVTKNKFFTRRVFEIFDKNKSGTIEMDEFMEVMRDHAGKSVDDKIRFLFKVYDSDGDGLIQHKELQDVISACMEENGMKFSNDQIGDLTSALFDDADLERRGVITFEALKTQLEKHGGLLENLSISIDRWLVPPTPKPPPASLVGKIAALKPYQLTLPYIKNNYVYLSFLACFLLVNLGLIIQRIVEFREANLYTIFARACGQCLNFNCMFVLVLMLRHSITFLRTRGFSRFLPLDQHIYFHKLTGVMIFVYSVIHTVMHLINFSTVVIYDPVLNAGNFTLTEWLFTLRPGLFGLIDGIANPTGFALIAIITVMFICSQPFVRRGGCFEIFYWTHLLYVPFWIILILHGPNFWKWYIIPGLIYLVERFLRFTWMRSERGKTYISSGLLLPSRVTHLVIKRPPHFDYHVGDYVFVNVPSIAKYEWHPFTISSAPEQEDYLWVHIRGVGEWTNRLHNYFEKEQEKLYSIEEHLSGGSFQQQLPVINGTGSVGVAVSGSTPAFQRMKKTITTKLSARDLFGNSRGKMVVFKGDQAGGYANQGFIGEDIHGSVDSTMSAPDPSSANDLAALTGLKKGPQNQNLHKMLMLNKGPLSKSLSMPDMDNKVKKRQRLLALRDFTRSESEKSFDESQMRRARLQSLGLAYLSPQNKSLAQSFRYMRNKPTIIAFKTPSLESCEAKLTALNLLGGQSSSLLSLNSDRAAEEGRATPRSATSPARPQINYPVGKPLEIYLDGPYGAPSNHIFQAQHAVLIGAGIGVTPFASILQSIMHRYWKARQSCPKCTHSWVSQIPSTIMHLRKVDFFWINRDQRSFEWFVNLLSQLEIEQAELGGAMERFLDMHMYITSALQKSDMKAVGLQLALDLLHEKEKRDLITGLKTRTNAGRPNWDRVFKNLSDQKKGKVTVFYCGPPQLARALRLKCDYFGFSFRKEVF